MGDRQRESAIEDDLRLTQSDGNQVALFALPPRTRPSDLSSLRIPPQIGMDTFPPSLEKNQRRVGADVLDSVEVHGAGKIARLPPLENCFFVCL